MKKDSMNHAGAQWGNYVSSHAQDGTEVLHKGMELFLKKANQIENVGYEQAKGNLFEYIETAKINRNLANKGVNRHYEATDAKKAWGGLGEPHAPDDIRGFENGRVIARGQAKVNNNANATAGSDKGITNPKYEGMQRNVASDKYNEVIDALDQKYAKGEISQAAYEDARSNLRQALTDEKSGITSGGTSTSELREAWEEPEKYVRKLEMKQYAHEIGNTTVNMAASSMVITAAITATQNMFEVFQNRKKLDEALKDVGVEVAKSGVRGGATGFLSSLLRIGGSKVSIPVISDGCVATTIAGGMIDCGVAIYAYAQGEIEAEQLKEELQNTAVKSAATIYFVKATQAVVGNVGPFVPMAVYTVASYIVTTTREIIKNAKLNAAEHNRVAALYEEAAAQMKAYREQLEIQMKNYVREEKEMLRGLIDTFEYNLETGENYDQAIYAIVNFSNRMGIALQHVKMDDFKKAMVKDDSFVL